MNVKKVRMLVKALESIRSTEGRKRSHHGVMQTASYSIAADALKEWRRRKPTAKFIAA